MATIAENLQVLVNNKADIKEAIERVIAEDSITGNMCYWADLLQDYEDELQDKTSATAFPFRFPITFKPEQTLSKFFPFNLPLTFVSFPPLRAYYNITTTSSATRIVRDGTNMNTISKMKIDGVEVTKTATYTFSSIGEHQVDFFFTSNTASPVCWSLTNVTKAIISSPVTHTGDRAFYACSNLTSLTLEDSVKTLGYGMCAGTKLPSMVLPDGITAIPDYCFSGDTSLKTINIPSSVTNIGQQAFYNCPLTNMEFDLSNVTTFKVGAFQQSTGVKKIILNNNITSFVNQVFQGCKNLSQMTLPPNITSIGGQCFQNVPFSEIILDNIVTLGGVSIFSGHHATRIKVGDSITTIPQATFSGEMNKPYLTTVELGSGITSIGQQAFLFNTLLQSFTIHATTPPTLGSNVFQTTNNTFKIYVPAESVDTYKAATGWTSYASRIQAIPT